jgi:hypothetical protein
LYAESQFALDKTPKKGCKTLRQQYEEVERTLGFTPPELVGLPELPECAAHVWIWFFQLSNRRTMGMAMNPITWPDIDAWSRLTGIKPRQWELDALTGIDDAYRAEMAPKD